MNHETPDPLGPRQHADPKGERSGGRGVGKGFALGVAAVVLGVPGLAMFGGWLDQRANPEADLAGLGGLFAGGIIGLVALAIGGAVAFVVGRRRDEPILRGAGLGMFVATGVAGISLGICAAVS
jgi:hypothetical protein